MDILKTKTTLALIIVVTFVLIGAAFLLRGGPDGAAVLSEGKATSVGTVSVTIVEPSAAPAPKPQPSSVSTGFVTLTLT